MDPNEELARRWFELHGCFVRTNVRYRFQTGKVGQVVGEIHRDHPNPAGEFFDLDAVELIDVDLALDARVDDELVPLRVEVP